MPALKLLNWELGLPVNEALENKLRRKFGKQGFFFNQHILHVLGSLKNSAQNNSCLDSQGLKSKNGPYRKGITADAYGPECYDGDNDGILDKDDDYFLSSPVTGKDSDNDGIVDKIDLVPWNHIKVSGNIDARKINLIGREDISEIEFSSNTLKILEIKTIYFAPLPVQIKPDHFPGRFPKARAETIKGKRIILEKDLNKPPIIRLEVHYEHKSKRYYRPYYFYFPGTPVLQIISEREWYYFLRYGADLPGGIDFYKVDSYDQNFDGIADNSEFMYFSIAENYDWDGDGFPDLIDTMPTVFGRFENDYVKGLKDSDNDSLADPGCLDFSPPNNWISAENYFGELPRILGSNPEFDRAPYLKGSRVNKGIPDGHFDL